MPLQLKIVSEHSEILGEDDERMFLESGGTIGRSLENDWILPDPDRFISGRHATVDFQSGAYYLADVSSNGVYINDEEEPLGKGNPRRLFDGDRLRMGDFEFLVSLDEGQDLAMPPPPAKTVVPDHIEQLVPEDEIDTDMQLLDEEEITGDEDFQAVLFGTAARKKEKTEMVDKGDNPFDAAPPPKVRKIRDTEDLLDAFLTGLGIDRSELHSSTDPAELMTNAGKVMHELVEGITDLLLARSNVKSMFRLDQTTVMPRHNNPIKLSENPSDSMKQLLVGKEGEYLGPVDAGREVCRDLKFHHDAMLEAMTRAFLEFTDRFDPDELRENFDRTLDKKPLFASMNQLKYWQLYCDLYPIMTEQGSGRLPHQFGEEFVRAYEKQLAEYKRLDSGDASLAAKRTPKAVVASTSTSTQEEELVDQVEHSKDW
jgi:predicted component of type VI protein secretion system